MRTYADQFSPAELREARAWCADCLWRDVDADYILEEATAETVARAIARHYDGGIAEFKRNHAPA